MFYNRKQSLYITVCLLKAVVCNQICKNQLNYSPVEDSVLPEHFTTAVRTVKKTNKKIQHFGRTSWWRSV